MPRAGGDYGHGDLATGGFDRVDALANLPVVEQQVDEVGDFEDVNNELRSSAGLMSRFVWVSSSSRTPQAEMP